MSEGHAFPPLSPELAAEIETGCRLIEAAPDLLKAAKRALAVFRAGKVHRDGNNVVAALEDAIAKASGGVA